MVKLTVTKLKMVKLTMNKVNIVQLTNEYIFYG
jgi:hypothetical protein